MTTLARAQMSSEALRVRFPAQVKVAPAHRVQGLVTLALPGIVLRPLPVVPPQIPVHAGYDYFGLEPGGERTDRAALLLRRFRSTGRAPVRRTRLRPRPRSPLRLSM
jgi:predicted component of type VI protein secretion system